MASRIYIGLAEGSKVLKLITEFVEVTWEKQGKSRVKGMGLLIMEKSKFISKPILDFCLFQTLQQPMFQGMNSLTSLFKDLSAY